MVVTDIVKRVWQTGVVSTFFAGLFLLLPIVLTLIILNWIIGKVVSVIGPGSFLGDLIASGGGTIIGPNHETLSFVLGACIALVSIWALGVVVKSQARNQIGRAVDYLFVNLPFVCTIYKPVSQVIRMFSNKEGSDLKGMSVVSCRFGSQPSVDVLGLITSSHVYKVGSESRRLVYLPTSPLPMSGGLVLMAEDRLVRMPDISVDDLMQIYFSMGVINPDHPVDAVHEFASDKRQH